MTGVNMMFGRFAVAIPALALAGALAGKKAVPEGPGTFTTHSGDLRRAADRRDRHRRRADVLPADCARTDRRAPPRAPRKDVLMLTQRRFERRPKARSLFDRAILTRAIARFVQEARSALAGAQSGHVRRRGRRARRRRSFSCAICAAHAAIAGFDFAIAAWLWFTVLFANFAEAVAEGRGKAQAESSAPHEIRYVRAPAQR